MDRKKKEFGFDFYSDLELQNGFRVSKVFSISMYDILRRNDDIVVRRNKKLVYDHSAYYVGFQ